MESITFHCKVITPMFLAGADGQTPELRAPSIKGAMRFWWRACHGHLPLHELKEKEDEIFGGPDRRSQVIITACYKNEEMNDDNVPRFNYLRDYKEDESGVKYFNVPFFQYDGIKAREAIAPEVEFFVTLRSREKEVLIEAATTFWVLSMLGGLGTRSRRCNGSFRIIKSQRSSGINSSELPFYKKSKSGKPQIGDVRKLKEVLNLSQSKLSVSFSFLEGATFFYSKGVVKGNGFQKWHEAVHDVAFKMMLIRDKKTRYGTGRNSLKFTMDDIDKKAAFGLPFGIQPSRDVDGTVNLYTSTDEELRRASPLVISVTVIGSRLYWTVTHLRGIFMPDDTIIKHVYRNGTPGIRKDKEDQTLVNEFVKRLEYDWKEEDEILDLELDNIILGNSEKVIKSMKF